MISKTLAKIEMPNYQGRARYNKLLFYVRMSIEGHLEWVLNCVALELANV